MSNKSLVTTKVLPVKPKIEKAKNEKAPLLKKYKQAFIPITKIATYLNEQKYYGYDKVECIIDTPMFDPLVIISKSPNSIILKNEPKITKPKTAKKKSIVKQP